MKTDFRCPICGCTMRSNEGHTGGVDVMLFCNSRKCGYTENYAEHEEKVR